MSNHVLDSSAILALILEEQGKDVVQQAIMDGSLVGTVNLSEVVGKLSDEGNTREQIEALLPPIRLEIVHFDEKQAWQAGRLRPITRQAGLTLGDRACLALGIAMGLPVLTADRVWAQLDVGVEVVVCR